MGKQVHAKQDIWKTEEVDQYSTSFDMRGPND